MLRPVIVCAYQEQQWQRFLSRQAASSRASSHIYLTFSEEFRADGHGSSVRIRVENGGNQKAISILRAQQC